MKKADTDQESEHFVWQDREVRFDVKINLLDNRKGEKVIDSINSVEDTKGNNGERGSLIVTNLRLKWVSHANSRINLSVGLNSILSVNIRKAKSKLKGHTQALCVLAKFNSRFEFVFTSLVKNSPRLFTTVQAVMRAYETSKLYRDLKLRGSIVRDGELQLLPKEQMYTRISGAWNLSSDQGNLGTFFLTNVRVVWHANLAANFNVSLPYMQIKTIRVRESKFGRALVIETFSRAGGYILGFRIDPAEKLEQVSNEVQKFHKLFSASPIFGVDFTLETEAPPLEQVPQARVEEDTSLMEDTEDTHAIAAYYADGDEGEDDSKFDSIRYDETVGLAVEGMQEGITLESLWRVI
jgi:Bardet-Biedl syndrome 5 protein